MNNIGFIYIYRCIVGANKDICKIGKTKHLGDHSDRLTQHLRTTYYGFTPYTDFSTGKVIATGFKVTDVDQADKLVKNLFKDRQVSSIEVYNVDYDSAIKELYDFLNANNLLVSFVEDGISAYDFLKVEDNGDTLKINVDTSKSAFEDIKEQLLSKYGNELPDELLLLLRDQDEFIEICPSHYKSGNYIDFPNNLVLDIHYNKMKRVDILSKLRDLL